METDLTIIFCVYGQPAMLAHQLQTIARYPESVRSRIGVVVVDDCGPIPIQPQTIIDFSKFVENFKVLRVAQDIPWNQPGGRNLGAHLSSGRLLLIDPDMVFDSETMARMIEAAKKLARGHVIKWGLKHVSSGKLDMTSPNTWLIHRDDFFSVGGYDEDFAGHKGWSDVQFLDVMRSCFKIENRPDLFAHFHGTDSVPDAMVKSLDRSTKHNRKIRLKKVAQARAAGGWARWAKARRDVPRLRFPWTQLYPTT